MDDKAKKELDSLIQMVRNWKEGYLGWVESPDDLYVVDELREECMLMMMPYLVRLMETEYITPVELQEFCAEVEEVVRELNGDVRKWENNVGAGVNVAELYSQFKIHRDLLKVDGQVEKLVGVALVLVPALMARLGRCCGGCKK